MSEVMEKQPHPFSLEQAGNWLKELKDNLVKTVKKTVAEKNVISVAPPRDCARFLSYGISLLDNVDSEHMTAFCKITGKSLHVYSGTELAELFRKFLTLRVNKISIERIAQYLQIPVETLKKVELIAISACSRVIEKSKVGAIPIVGG